MSRSTFRIATHANLALANPEFRIGNLPEFAGETEWVFLVPGPNGHKLRLVPDDWIATMRALGARSAWYGYGPSANLRGEGVWTEGAEGFCFYRLIVVKTEDGHSRSTLTGHPASSPTPLTDVSGATARLRETLPQMLAVVPRSSEFKAWLDDAAAILDGRTEPPASALEAFPPGFYPPEHIRLFAGAERGDVFGTGGMGWWYDNSERDEAFDRVSRNYARTLYPAFVAASKLKIDPR